MRGASGALVLCLAIHLALPATSPASSTATSPISPISTSPASPAAGTTTVAPGSVARWDGPGTTRCGMGGESWAPLGETCWYPVDLLREEGPLTVERVRNGSHEAATIRVGPYPYREERIHLGDDRHVHLSPKDAARARREAEQVAAIFTLRGPARFSLPLGPPLDDAPPARNFGTRRVFNGEPRNPHTGVDFAAGTGTPVLAVAPGRVALAAEHFFPGRCVFLDHGDGLVSMYFHLSRLDVADGERVEKGRRIGAVGATGRASGPHLHFGLRWRGAKVDPSLLLGDPDAAPRVSRVGFPAGR